MRTSAIFRAIKEKLSECVRITSVAAFCGDTTESIKASCAEFGDCACVSFESSEIVPANASFRIKSSVFTVYYACTIALAENGGHLDRIEDILNALHGFRVDNSTLKPRDFKIVNRDALLVYALNFEI